jgi:hypothetical protein
MNTLIVALLMAQCPNGNCRLTTQTPKTPAPYPFTLNGTQNAYRWVQLPKEKQWALFQGNSQLGNFYEETGKYRKYYPEVLGWGQEEAPPIEAPVQVEPEPKGLEKRQETAEKKTADVQPLQELLDESGERLLFGVVPSPHENGHNRYWVNDKEVSRTELYQKMDRQVTDQSGKPFLTIIGPDSNRKAVLADIEKSPPLKELIGNYRLNAYAPDDWHVARLGFVSDGKPTIYVQEPNGRVVHRQDEYHGPDELIGVLRKANDNYRKDKDPNLATIGLVGLPLEAWLVIGLLFFFLIPRGDKK